MGSRTRNAGFARRGVLGALVMSACTTAPTPPAGVRAARPDRPEAVVGARKQPRSEPEVSGSATDRALSPRLRDAVRRFAAQDVLGASAALSSKAEGDAEASLMAGHLLEQAERWCSAAKTYRRALGQCSECPSEAAIRERVDIAGAACPESSSRRDVTKLELLLARQTVMVWQKSEPSHRATKRRALEEARRVATQAAAASLWSSGCAATAQDLIERFESRSTALTKRADLAINRSFDDVIEARAVVQVSVPQLRREVERICSDRELPRVIVVTLERQTDEKGKSRPVATPVVKSMLEQGLRAAGFELVAGDHLAELALDEESLLDPKRDRDPAARRLAQRFQAEILLKARSTVVQRGANKFGTGDIQSSLQLAYRAIDEATGALLGADSFTETGSALCTSEALLYDCAARHAAPDMIDAIVEDIQSGPKYRIVVEGMTSGKQANRFIAMLEELPDVATVGRYQYASGQLQVQVSLKSEMSVDKLGRRVLARASRYSNLRKMRLRLAKGRSLRFSFTR